jgi:uncharacterized protein (TIGR04255 family)
MTHTASSLGVDYERPPVIEVVCGIQFEELKGLTAARVGAFWTGLRSEYPQTSSVPPLPHVIEGPIEPLHRPAQRLRLKPAVLPRTFFIHTSKNWVIQIQADRFLHNWRNESGDQEYPRFPRVIERFQAHWSAFRDFCGAEEMAITIDQLELTYINHVPRGDGWESLGEVGRIFPDISWRRERRFLPVPEVVSWEAKFLLPGEMGRLHVSVSPGVHQDTKQEVLLCELTARGMPSSSDDSALADWFQLGREWIVKGFADLASRDIQTTIWRRTT